MVVMLVGNVEPQTGAVGDFLRSRGIHCHFFAEPDILRLVAEAILPDLIIVAGWRHLIPSEVLAIPKHGTVGFHSARLPEYPGRAPVPWALVRGDEWTENTLFYLDEGVDTGDIIDRRRIALHPDMTPELVYAHMARTCVEMLGQHFDALLDGTAPREPQDPTKRGRLTTPDGWAHYYERQRLGAGHG